MSADKPPEPIKPQIPIHPIRHLRTRIVPPPSITYDQTSFVPAFKKYIAEHYKGMPGTRFHEQKKSK